MVGISRTYWLQMGNQIESLSPSPTNDPCWPHLITQDTGTCDSWDAHLGSLWPDGRQAAPGALPSDRLWQVPRLPQEQHESAPLSPAPAKSRRHSPWLQMPALFISKFLGCLQHAPAALGLTGWGSPTEYWGCRVRGDAVIACGWPRPLLGEWRGFFSLSVKETEHRWWRSIHSFPVRWAEVLAPSEQSV